MTNKIIVIITLTLVVTYQNISAQGFKAMGIVGLNASQIDGDNLYGFNKLGLTVGGRLSYTNEKTLDYSLEMLYSQRGAALNLFKNKEDEKINLNYLEIPLVVSLRDWYQEKDGYYKVRAEAGLSFGYLFGAESSLFDTEKLKNLDINWLLGVGLNFNKMLGFSIRYTSSFLDLYNDNPNAINFKSYFLTFRTEVNF
jgi:hypothetical protein